MPISAKPSILVLLWSIPKRKTSDGFQLYKKTALARLYHVYNKSILDITFNKCLPFWSHFDS